MASAVATPLERRFGRIAGLTEITSTSSLGATSLTLQFDLDRDVDAAARDVQAAINAAGGELPPNLPTRPDYRKVNPADAPILILSLTSRRSRSAKVFDVGQHRPRAEDRPGRGRRAGLRRRRPAAGGARAGRPGGARRAGPRPRGRARALAAGHGDPAQGRARRRRSGAEHRRQRSALRRGRSTRHSSSPTATAPPCASATWPASSTTSRTTASPRGPTASASVLADHPPPAGRQHHRDHRARQGAPARAGALDLPGHRARGRARPQPDHPRLGARRRAHAAPQRRPRGAGRLRLPAQRLRATLIPSVAVPLSLVGTFGVMYLLDYSLEQPVADGAHHLDRLRRRRRHRRDREHHPLHRARAIRPSTAALKGAKQIGFTIVSITASLLAVFIPHPAHGRHRRAPLPRVRGHAQRRDRDLGGGLAHAHADDVLAPAPATRGARGTGASTGFRARLRAACSAATAAASSWVLDHRAHARRHARAAAASPSGSSSSCPRGSFPQQDTGVLTGFSEAPQDISFPAMKERQEAINAVVLPGSRRRAPWSRSSAAAGRRRQHRLRVRRAEAACRSARRAPTRSSRALRPEARHRCPGVNLLPPGGAGRAHRRPRRAHAVPVHAAGREPRRAPAGRRACSSGCGRCPSSRTWRPTSRPRASSSTSPSIATRRRASASRRSRSTTRSTTPSASARSRRSSPS